MPYGQCWVIKLDITSVETTMAATMIMVSLEIIPSIPRNILKKNIKISGSFLSILRIFPPWDISLEFSNG